MPVLTPSSGLTDTLRFGDILVLSTITVFSTGALVGNSQVPISVATVTVTRNSAQRRQLTMTVVLDPTIPPPPLLPTSPSAILTPFGNEITVKIGIAPGGKLTTVTWVPLGRFAMSTVSVQDITNDLVVTVEGYDRSWVIAQRKFKTPYNVPATTGNFVTEIKHLLNTRWGSNKPALSYNITPTTKSVPTMVANQGATPWTVALQMAASVGYELFFNATGVVTGYPIPTPAKQPVTWNFTDTVTAVYGQGGATGGGGSQDLLGSPYSTPAEVTIQYTRDGIFNDVLVTGTGSYNTPGSTSGSTAPVLGEAKTTNPQSSTYVTGPVGDIPEFISSNMILAADTAQDAATNYLQAALSDAWQITITSPPIPFLDIDDVVSVTRPRAGLNNVKMVIDSIGYKVSYADLVMYTGRVVT